MIINTKQVLKTLEGEDYKDGEKDLTVGLAIAKQLATVKSDDPLKSYILSKDFYEKEELDLSAEDIVFVKKILKDSTFFPYLTGHLIELIDPKAAEGKVGVNKNKKA